jgi:hypothetical protein
MRKDGETSHLALAIVGGSALSLRKSKRAQGGIGSLLSPPVVLPRRWGWQELRGGGGLDMKQCGIHNNASTNRTDSWYYFWI